MLMVRPPRPIVRPSCRSIATVRRAADRRKAPFAEPAPMPRTQKVLSKGASSGEPRREIADTLLLKFDDRRKQQGFVFGGKGTCVEFDFPEPPRLCTDDLLLLDDGRLAEVVADIEPVIEVRAKDFAAVARLVLTLGNRHIPVQILPNRIRLQKLPEIEALLAQHGLSWAEVAAPFEPDDDPHAHAHDHGHDEHGHHHAHHDHEHDHHGHDDKHHGHQHDR
jgi:urease accessory protein